MRTAVKWLIFLVLLGTALCYADSAPGQFKHVIIVVQENRTPDNLFGGVPPQNGWTGPWFENGVDLAIAPTAPPAQGGQPGQPWCLGACFNPGHGNSNWHTQHTNGLPIQKKDPSTCGSTSLITFCNNQPVCGVWTGTNWAGCSGHGTPIPLPKWPEESFVGYNLDMVGSRHLLDPYVQIATQYGFGNYFYQTNQGPSQPAHNFLLGGTAAPTGVVGQNNFYNYFASGNDGSGCQGALSHRITLENPDGNLGDSKFPQQGLYPCWERQTMPDLLMSANAGLTWKYYTNSTNSIWVAPNQIQHLCLAPGTPQGNPCNSPNFANVQPTKNFFADFPTGPSLLTTPNTTQCNLPSVAWIIPDGKNSDHPGLGGTSTSSTDKEGGPNWVASIVNAVGQATCVEPDGRSPWFDTVIFVVWDDWGGWYDHIPRGYLDNFLVNGVNTGQCPFGYTDNGPQFWGCGYTYGFRVPFLVVSAYTPARTVSGFCAQNVDCVGNGSGVQNVPPHQHDFGSILAFIEYNFSLGIGCINNPTDVHGAQCPINNGQGGIPFADYWAPEVQSGYNPLGDFFPTHTALGFAPITLINNSFTLDYFRNFNGPFEDPDDDMVDPASTQ